MTSRNTFAKQIINEAFKNKIKQVSNCLNTLHIKSKYETFNELIYVETAYVICEWFTPFGSFIQTYVIISIESFFWKQKNYVEQN